MSLLSDTDFPQSILLFGCGNMGGAMLRGWIAAGVPAARFVVLDPFVTNLPDGVLHIKSAAEMPIAAAIILLAVKPQMLAELRDDIARCMTKDATLISIMAGIDIAKLQSFFPHAQIVRLMPNLAAAIGKSPMALFGNSLDTDQRRVMAHYLSPLGPPIWLEAEDQMNAVTALAGSGPAFVYRFIDALASGGEALGLSQATAHQLAMAMIGGAAELAAQSAIPPNELAAQVTSPGGTTAAGLAILDESDALCILIENTLRAARARGDELGKIS
jgi:pyrroline-5-carboxylate reductase